MTLSQYNSGYVPFISGKNAESLKNKWFFFQQKEIKTEQGKNAQMRHYVVTSLVEKLCAIIWSSELFALRQELEVEKALMSHRFAVALSHF